MTHPDDTEPIQSPTEADVAAAQHELREAGEATYRLASDQLPRSVERIATRAATSTARRIGAIGVIFAALVALAMSLTSLSLASSARESSAAAQLAAETAQQQVAAAMVKLDEANRTLTARGQAPVPSPRPPDPTSAIAAAVLAQVLAQLPPTPTAEQVAERLQATVTANVLGPTTDQLARLVAGYFATNPPKPGPPPTQQQIQAAVDRAYAQNPPKNGTDGAPGPIGAPGPPGKDGAPGPACPPGTRLTAVRFAGGESGQGCVTTPTTTVPAPTSTTAPN